MVAKYGKALLPPSKSVDAAIYCVGHCPPGGSLEAVSQPLSRYSPIKLQQEIGWHILGPFNVFQEFLPIVRDGGHFVFMSSAITRILQMPPITRPPIHPYHHIAVIVAEDALIEGMRMDPEVAKRGIKIHKIMPPAISDSPFHKTESDIGPRPPITVTTGEVVKAITKSLLALSHEDVLMLPQK
ncbi:MAG: hypothetical protein WC217_02615 [Candidatus Paceibacterota bacterium]